MKFKKIYLVSLLLLAILTLGAASAAENVTADDLAVEDAGDLEVSASDEISADGDTDNVAVGENETYEDSSDVVLGVSSEEKLTDPVDPTVTHSIDLPKSSNGARYIAEWGQPIVVSANYGNATGNVSITFADETYSTELVDGAFTYTITKYSKIANNQVLKVLYYGDENYNSVSYEEKIQIRMNKVVVTDASFGQSAYVNVNLFNATGNVTATVNGVTYRKELLNGTTVLEIKNYNVGSNTVEFAYEGDGIYNPITKSVSFGVQFKDIVATGAVFGQSANVSVNMGNFTGNVTFTVNGVTYRKELVNGTAFQEIKNYALGSNSVKFTYEGNGEYEASASATFSTTVNIDAPTVYNFQPAVITVNLGEATGNVTFVLGNETQTVDVINGVATYKTNNYVIGDNTVKITYSGDNTFNSFSTTNKFTVLEKENTTILSSVYKTSDKNMVLICIPFGTGNVSAIINGKQENLELIDGVAYYNIDASDVITEINVTYDGNYRLNPAKSFDFVNLENNIVNNENYMYYFNQADDGTLFAFIKPGTTLDFQGSIINPDRLNYVFMNINVPVNIVSTTGDGYINLNSSSQIRFSNNNKFSVTHEGSGSNITGISFYNTRIHIINASNVVLDKLNIIYDQAMGAGATSFQANSTYITFKNSYFYSINNGGSAAFTFAWADNCTLDNNTFAGKSGSANFIYYYVPVNQYGLKFTDTYVNSYNNFTNNKFYGEEANVKITISSGTNNLFENNTLINTMATLGMGIRYNNYVVGTLSASGDVYGNYVVGTLSASGDVYGNYVVGTLSTSGTVYNNTVTGIMTISSTEMYNNTVGGLTINGVNVLVYDNIINGTTTINGATDPQIRIYNNTFIGDYAIKFNNANAKNVTFSENDVIGYIEFFNQNAKNNKILNNTITTSQDYAVNLKTLTGTETIISGNILNSAKGFGNDAVNHADDSTLIIDNYQNASAEISVAVDDIKVGETAVFNVITNETAMSSVKIIVGNKKYSVNLVDGKGALELNELLSGKYDVSVYSIDLTYAAKNSTTFEVYKNIYPEIVVDAPAKIQWVDSNITVTIKDATGSVTLNINGSDLTSEIVNGVAIFTVPDLAIGSYEFNITYSGDYKYYGNTTNGTLTVNKNKEIKIIASDIVDYGLANKFTAQFTNYLGEAIANANVTITVDDEIFSLVTDENGTATANFVLFRGNYNVNVTFKEIPDEFDSASAEYTIKVIDRSVIKIVSVNGDGLITGMLCDSIEEPIANAEIIASMDGSNTTVTTNDDGLFEFKAKNGLIVQFKFEGDNITTASDASITLNNVVHDLRDVSIIKITSIDGQDIITGLLADTTGNPIANVTVIAKMNGAETTLTTDNAGLFKFQAKNGFEATFEFAGDNTTTPANTSIALNYAVPELKGTTINVTSVSRAAADTGAGEKGKAYKLTLKDAQGNALANKTVQIALNGKVYKAVTNENGIASIVISLNAAKKYNLNAFFIGDDDYKGSTAAAKVTITKKKTAIKPAKTKYTFKAKAKSKVIKATLKTSNKYLKAGKKVTIKIKGKTYTAKTGKNGAVKLNIKVLSKKGTYKAKIKFAGDSTYKASTSKTIKIVIK